MYFNIIRPADIEVLIGNKIKTYYHDFNDKNHGTGFYLPIDFVNTSNRAGTVIKTAIVFHKKSEPSELFLMQQESFSKFDSNSSKWIFDEMAHSIVINSKTSVNKIVWYYWSSESSPKIEFSKGEYQIKVLYWLNEKKKPKHVEFNIYIDNDLADKFKNLLENQKATTTDIIVNKAFEVNKYMTLIEEKKLFE